MSVSSSAYSFCDSAISASPRVDPAGGGVEAQVAGLEHGGALGGAAPRERAQAREQLLERERLHEVVVGAAVEAGDAVLDGVARGEHQDRRPHVVSAQAAADLEPVEARQHHVEHDDVVLGRAGHPDRVLAAVRDVHGYALFLEPALDEARHLGLVLNNEHAHGYIFSRLMRAR